MLAPIKSAISKVMVGQTLLAGGLDLISPPGLAKPGSCRFAINYEADFGGGYSRIGGFERFDGHTPPSRAEYVMLEAAAGFDITVGATVTGSTSGAEGKVIYVSPDGKQICLTRLLPGFVFTEGEDIELTGTPRGTITNDSPIIDGFLDNDMAYLAGEEYRTPIQKPPGDGPIRGVAVLKNILYAWRDDGANLKIYKALSAGWTLINLGNRVSFQSGSTIYPDGGSLTQGSVSAIIRRVVLVDGDWLAGTAEGYFVIDTPVGGNFSAGAATGSGVSSLTGAQTPITLASGGKVRTVVYNFYGSEDSVRLYGCDGVNKEFEFDGTAYVPLETGMGSVRADFVACHKSHLFYAFGASVQHSGTGEPYIWAPIFGAAEIGTGDPVTNFISVPGSEVSAALMITCRDSVHVLYGSSSTDWKLVKVSDGFGAQADSGMPMFGTIAFDREGFIQYSPTNAFGNFSNNQASRAVEPMVRGASVNCAVLTRNRSAYRCFFADGLFMTAIQYGRQIVWMPGDYGRSIVCAVGGEIAGIYRVFMGDSDGWVLEADVGRSFDGEVIDAGIRLANVPHGGPITLSQYRTVELQTEPSSAFEIALGAEFFDSNADEVGATITSPTDFKKQYGTGLFWDFNSWDRAYWDGAAANRVIYEVVGQGRSLGLLLSSTSDRELPHALRSVIVTYTPRRIAR